MNKNKYYSGIDWMRLIAAVLVITIHTSPLASYNTTGDFMIGRIRLSVTVKLQFCRLAMGMDFREIYHAERQV